MLKSAISMQVQLPDSGKGPRGGPSFDFFLPTVFVNSPLHTSLPVFVKFSFCDQF